MQIPETETLTFNAVCVLAPSDESPDEYSDNPGELVGPYTGTLRQILAELRRDADLDVARFWIRGATLWVAMKIKTTKITIRRAEGPMALQRPIEFVGGDCWTQATDWLGAMAPTFPVFGYDKHDILVEWEDGEVYRGRMDCTATGNLDVARHVRTEAEFVAGTYRPPRMTDGQWELWAARHACKRDEAINFLGAYQIGD